MSDKKLSDHGYPLIMACDHVLHQKSTPVQCDYSPPDYICEECNKKMDESINKTKEEQEQALKFVHLYCSHCIKEMMFD